MRAHWRHLANTIELVHPSAHSCPQPKRQMNWFSRFCTAYGRKCLYFTMGAPIHQNCPFPWGIWTFHVTHDALGHANQQPKRHLDRFSRVCTDDRRVSLYWFACFPPQNCSFPCWRLDLMLYMVHWAQPSSERKWQLDRFSYYCRAHY